MPDTSQTPQIDTQGRTRNSDTVTRDRRITGQDFAATLSAVDAPATYLVAREVDGVPDPTIEHQAAAATHATLNGVAGATNGYGYGAPYLGAPPATQGFGPPSTLASTNNHGGFGVSDPGNFAGPGGAPGAGTPGSAGGFSNDYYEKRALLTQMNDANWQMLLLQNDVQNINREFTIMSNIMSVRHQTDMNMLRNTGRAAG